MSGVWYTFATLTYLPPDSLLLTSLLVETTVYYLRSNERAYSPHIFFVTDCHDMKLPHISPAAVAVKKQTACYSLLC